MASSWIITLRGGSRFELSISIDEDKISDHLSSTWRCASAYRKARRTGKAKMTRLNGGVIAELRLLNDDETFGEEKTV